MQVGVEYFKAVNTFLEPCLRPAFDAVADKAHWKNPINARIANHPLVRQLVAEAITFYAGGGATFEVDPSDDSKLIVRAPGYYVRIGA